MIFKIAIRSNFKKFNRKILLLDIKYIAYIPHYLYHNSKKYLKLPQKIVVNLLFLLTLLKLRLRFQIFGMLLILANKSTDIIRVYGNGGRVGEVRQWPSREQAELEEQLMDIVIVCIPLHYTQILWKNTLYHRYANCLCSQFFYN